MIFAMEKVKFLHGAGEVTLSGGRLVGVSVAIALPVENGCMVDRSCNQGTVFKISFRKDDEFKKKKKKESQARRTKRFLPYNNFNII